MSAERLAAQCWGRTKINPIPIEDFEKSLQSIQGHDRKTRALLTRTAKEVGKRLFDEQTYFAEAKEYFGYSTLSGTTGFPTWWTAEM